MRNRKIEEEYKSIFEKIYKSYKITLICYSNENYIIVIYKSLKKDKFYVLLVERDDRNQFYFYLGNNWRMWSDENHYPVEMEKEIKKAQTLAKLMSV